MLLGASLLAFAFAKRQSDEDKPPRICLRAKSAQGPLVIVIPRGWWGMLLLNQSVRSINQT